MIVWLEQCNHSRFGYFLEVVPVEAGFGDGRDVDDESLLLVLSHVPYSLYQWGLPCNHMYVQTECACMQLHYYRC